MVHTMFTIMIVLQSNEGGGERGGNVLKGGAKSGSAPPSCATAENSIINHSIIKKLNFHYKTKFL